MLRQNRIKRRNVIGKMESFSDDLKYIVKRQNLTHLIPVNATAEKAHSSVKEDKPMGATRKFFRQLTRSQILRLYHIYKPDFLLFDYKAEEFLKIQAGIENSIYVLSIVNRIVSQITVGTQ